MKRFDSSSVSRETKFPPKTPSPASHFPEGLTVVRGIGSFLLVWCWLSSGLVAQERVWTDTQGRTMRAQFLREADGDAVFLKDGKLLTIPLARFTETDQEAIRKLALGQPAPGDDSPQDPFVTVRPAPPAPTNGFALAPSLVRTKTEIVVRDWSDAAGNRTSGKFVRVNGSDVILLRGSRTLAVKFAKLSLIDQLYVNQLLEERGQQPLIAAAESTAGQDGGESEGPGPREAVIQPRVAEPGTSESVDDGRVASANSQFFQELRSRQEETRESQAEFAATAVDVGEESASGTAELGADVAEVTIATPHTSPASATPDRALQGIRGGLLIKSETLAELRPVLIVGLVVLGLFGAVGTVVYIATAVAASNSTRRHNRYL